MVIGFHILDGTIFPRSGSLRLYGRFQESVKIKDDSLWITKLVRGMDELHVMEQ